MSSSVATPAQSRPTLDLKAAARALGASGGGAGAAQLLKLLCDPEVETESVRACLRSEPALSARVLKVANSPYYHQAGQVGTVDRAVQLLGLSAIRGIAAAGCLDRTSPPRTGQAYDPERFRLHSLATACAAQQLSRAAGAGIDSEAFIAGLLHDIGVLLLVKAAPLAMASFKPPRAESDPAALAAERAHFGADHTQCAGLLVEAWGLPVWLHDALAAHHTAWVDDRGPLNGLAALPLLLRLADDLAGRAGLPLWPGQAGDAIADADAAGLPSPLTAQDLERISAELPASVSAIAGHA